MSDEKKYTEREAVLRERKAFKQGSWWRFRRMMCESGSRTVSEDEIELVAAGKYALPKLSRPRVVVDSENIAWRVEDGGIKADGYRSTAMFHVSNERVALWADLLAHPTEEVDA